MAAFSNAFSYDEPPWKSLNGENQTSPSPALSESYTTEVCTTTTTNGSYLSPSIEEVFKSKLTVSSDSQATSSYEDEEAEAKLSSALMSFRDKIQYLEKQRELLEDRWSMLQVEETSEKDLEPIYLSYISRLLAQVNSVTKQNNQTQRSLLDMMDSINDVKDKYEEEFNQRTDMEYAFVELKKDVDACSLDKTELEVKEQQLKGLIDLLINVYELELKGLMEESDISVFLNIDNKCPVQFENMVQEIKERYHSIAAKSREEAQALSRKKLQQGVLQAGRYETELESSRSHITQLNSQIQRMRSEVLSIQTQRMNLEQDVSVAKANSNSALTDANSKLTEVQEALQNAKQDVAKQMREHQNLMNVKLALDIEIATYNKLLEGEESRLNSPPVVNVHSETEVRRPSRSRNSSSSWSVHSSTSDY